MPRSVMIASSVVAAVIVRSRVPRDASVVARTLTCSCKNTAANLFDSSSGENVDLATGKDAGDLPLFIYTAFKHGLAIEKSQEHAKIWL